LLYAISYPLIRRSVYKQGIYEIPKMLNLTLDHLVSHDMSKTNLLLWFYQAIFSLLPIFSIEDLRNKCKEIYGEITDEEIKKSKLKNQYDIHRIE
jgi:hypothetical protein